MSKITSEELQAYKDAYITLDTEDDHHQAFADLLSVTRNEAKELCYKITYSVPITKDLLVENSKLYRKVRDLGGN